MTDHPEQQNQTTESRLGLGTVVRHPSNGLGRIVGYDDESCVIIFKGKGAKFIPLDLPGITVVEAVSDPESSHIKQAVREALQDYGWMESDIEIAPKWSGGPMVLLLGNDEVQEKEIPIEAFFKKIIGVREKLRVLEQKINNNKNLSGEEKLELQGYITRCYGSLTTFNVLFASRDSQFKGSGGT